VINCLCLFKLIVASNGFAGDSTVVLFFESAGGIQMLCSLSSMVIVMWLC